MEAIVRCNAQLIAKITKASDAVHATYLALLQRPRACPCKCCMLLMLDRCSLLIK